MNIEFNNREKDDLDKMMIDLNITDIKDLLNVSLSLLQWAINERKKGNIIASLNEEDSTFQQVIEEHLDNIAKIY